MSTIAIIIISALILLIGGVFLYCKCKNRNDTDRDFTNMKEGEQSATANFWTPELIKKFNHIDFSKKDNREQTREIIQKLYNQNKEASSKIQDKINIAK